MHKKTLLEVKGLSDLFQFEIYNNGRFIFPWVFMAFLFKSHFN